ncbi:MAG: orc1/cdc6 family replication initiation protein [Candidatus Aenigmarchaeota archaeon]|nr:orc1/cdc6 family replication initiation protein [Candidatus Aenigmarchaeota archaeon]
MYEFENKIIKDGRVLKEQFIPSRIVHRDGQLKVIRDNLRPLLKRQQPRSMFIHGSPGTGKTCISKYVTEELSAHVSSVLHCYVNCWLYPSTFKILFSILQEFGVSMSIHRKGTPTDELFDIFRKRLQDRQCVIVLDEVDQLEDDKILYDLARMENVGLMLISNDEHALGGVDPRVRSSLASVDTIHFPPYSFEEIRDILRDRAEWGLLPGVVAKAQVDWIARVSSGDARIALNVLRLAAEAAENKDREGISDEHIRAALPKVHVSEKEKATERLNEHQRMIYGIISQSGEIKPEDLYPEYEKACKKNGVDPIVDRSVRKCLEKLAQYKLVLAKGEGRWRVYSVGKEAAGEGS